MSREQTLTLPMRNSAAVADAPGRVLPNPTSPRKTFLPCLALDKMLLRC